MNDQETCDYTRTLFFQTIHPRPEQNLLTFDWLPHDCVDLWPRCCTGQQCKHVTNQGIGFHHIDPILDTAITCYGCHDICHKNCTEKLDCDHPYCINCVNIILCNQHQNTKTPWEDHICATGDSEDNRSQNALVTFTFQQQDDTRYQQFLVERTQL